MRKATINRHVAPTVAACALLKYNKQTEGQNHRGDKSRSEIADQMSMSFRWEGNVESTLRPVTSTLGALLEITSSTVAIC